MALRRLPGGPPSPRPLSRPAWAAAWTAAALLGVAALLIARVVTADAPVAAHIARPVHVRTAAVASAASSRLLAPLLDPTLAVPAATPAPTLPRNGDASTPSRPASTAVPLAMAAAATAGGALAALVAYVVRRGAPAAGQRAAEQHIALLATTGEAEPPPAPLPSRRAVLQTLAASQLLGPTALPPAPSALAAPGPAPAFALPPLGVGCWAWGDALFWGYDAKNDAELQAAFNYLLDNGVDFFDTAEIYGFGRSEQLLGQFAEARGRPVAVATKFAALPWRVKASDVVDACQRSLQRLGKDRLELYQIHFPNRWANEEYWDGLARCYELGLVRAVGVSNYGSDAVRAVHAALAARGVPLTSNQIQYSLLYPYANTNGLKATCDELGVKILAYSPLGLGLLTGKYSATNLPSGPRGALARLYVEDPAYLALLETMRAVAAAHGIDRGDTSGPVQVALNWCRAKGTVPIPGVRSVAQARQNIACLQWDLTAEETAQLDRAAQGLPLPLTAPFPKEDIFTHLKMFDS